MFVTIPAIVIQVVIAEASVLNLGHPDFHVRHATTEQLRQELKYQERDCPTTFALRRACKSKDAEVRKRAQIVLEKVDQEWMLEYKPLPWIGFLPEDYPNKWGLYIYYSDRTHHTYGHPRKRDEWSGCWFATRLLILDQLKAGCTRKELGKLLIDMKVNEITIAKRNRHRYFSRQYPK